MLRAEKRRHNSLRSNKCRLSSNAFSCEPRGSQVRKSCTRVRRQTCAGCSGSEERLCFSTHSFVSQEEARSGNHAPGPGGRPALDVAGARRGCVFQRIPLRAKRKSGLEIMPPGLEADILCTVEIRKLVRTCDFAADPLVSEKGFGNHTTGGGEQICSG